MIQHSTISRKQSSLLTSATDDEIHVAQILLQITTMIRTLESGSGLEWGCKKRRSRSDEAASPYQKTDVKKGRPPPPKAEMEAAATASPVTPLAFSLSEPDDHKSKHLFNKTSQKMLRKEYIDMIEELSQRRDLLRGEIENVTNYHNKLIAYNSQLKALKQEALNSCPRKEEPKLESGIDRNLAMELTPKNYQKFSMETETHPQPLVEDEMMAKIFQSSYFGPISSAQYNSAYNGLGSTNHVGPIGIPDLNVCAEEIVQDQPLDYRSGVFGDDRRSRSAEARRRRMDIIRVKSMRRGACVFKFPTTR